MLNGGGGSDSLNGGSGRDVIISGKGADLATGGADAGSFVYNRGDVRGNVVTDFQIDEDVVQIGRVADRFGQIKIRDDSNDAIVRFANVKILLEDVDHTQIDATSFVFV